MQLIHRLKRLFSSGPPESNPPAVPLSLPGTIASSVRSTLATIAPAPHLAKCWAEPAPRLFCEMSDQEWAPAQHFELLVADNSTSMREGAAGHTALDILRTECGKFLDRMSQRDTCNARIGFIWFTSDCVLAVPWTAALAEVGSRAFGNIPHPGITNFTAALLAALELVHDQPFPAGASVAVRFFTDGKHNGSGEPLQVAEELKRLGVILHFIGCGDREENVDATLLRQMASRNADGELMYEFAGTPGELERVLNEVVDGLERWNP